jgi:hypothetical protein
MATCTSVSQDFCRRAHIKIKVMRLKVDGAPIMQVTPNGLTLPLIDLDRTVETWAVGVEIVGSFHDCWQGLSYLVDSDYLVSSEEQAACASLHSTLE